MLLSKILAKVSTIRNKGIFFSNLNVRFVIGFPFVPFVVSMHITRYSFEKRDINPRKIL